VKITINRQRREATCECGHVIAADPGSKGVSYEISPHLVDVHGFKTTNINFKKIVVCPPSTTYEVTEK
jgi:hypothetical protein